MPDRDKVSDYVVETLAEDITLRDRLAIIARHWVLIATVVVLSAAIGAYRVSNAVTSYRAESTVRFESRQGTIAPAAAPVVVYGLPTDQIMSQIRLLKSRAVAEEAVDSGMLQLNELSNTDALSNITGFNGRGVTATDTLRFRFSKGQVTGTFGKISASGNYGTPLDFRDFHLSFTSRPLVDAATFIVIPREQAIAIVRSGIVAKLEPETDVADLTFTGNGAVFAERVVNAATLGFQALDRRSAQQSARARKDFIAKRIAAVDSLLQKRTDELNQFRSVNNTFSSRDKITAEEQNQASTELRRRELKADRQVYATLLAKAVRMQDGDRSALTVLASAPGVGANPMISRLSGQLADLYTSRDSLTTGPNRSAPTNPDVQRLDVLIKSRTEELINGVKSQLMGLDTRIASFESLGATSAAKVTTLPRAAAYEAQLQREIDRTLRIQDELRVENQRAEIAEASDIGQITIIDLARGPGYPLPGSGSRPIFLATMWGLLIGFALSTLAEEFTGRFHSLRDVERSFRLPILGIIPRLKSTSVSGIQTKRGGAAISKMKQLASLPGARDGVGLMNPSDPVFEAFRTVRTSLIFSDAVEHLKTIVITSAVPGEGKTTVVANLAAAFAQQGMRVLATDCDLRRGRLHALFGASRRPGITEVILGRSDLDATIHQTESPNLSLLTAGSPPPNPAELLGSYPIRKLLADLQLEYDMVIIDGPPLLSAADAAILSSMVDGVILLVRMGKTDRRATKQALQRLGTVGARVLGTVMNDPDDILRAAGDYYYYSYPVGVSTASGSHEAWRG